MRGTNRPPFTAADIQDVSEHRFPSHTQCACNPGCLSCAPSCGRSGPDIPFALPADSIEITLDLPRPPSTNRIWRNGRGRTYKSAEYVRWAEEADIAFMLARTEHLRTIGKFPKIHGPFEVRILLAIGRGDGDNRIKALLDWAESRDLVRNDSDCRKGSWEWVEPERAPKGCRIILRSLHG